MSKSTNNDSKQDRGQWTSASAAEADLKCPGRHLLCQQVPEPEPSEDASSGRRIHAILADSQDTVLLLSLTPDERETFDRCREIEKAVALQFFGDDPGNMRVFREERRWVKFQRDGRECQHSGQADVVFRAGKRALVVDYKTGRDEAPASPRNLQLRDLACFWHNHLMVEETGTVVIQPWVTSRPDVCLYTKEDIARATEEMFDRVARSNNPDSPRVPGEVQCQFCRAKTNCPEYNKWASSQLPVATQPLLDLPVTRWTPEQCVLFIERLAVAQKWLDNSYDAIRYRLMKDPNCIPGLQLKEGRMRRVIMDPQAVYDRFEKLGGTVEGFMECVNVVIDDLAKQIGKVTGAKGSALTEAINALLDGLVERKPTRPSVERVEEKPKPVE